MESSINYNNDLNYIEDENFDFSNFLSQNSFFPPTPESNRIYSINSKVEIHAI